MSVPIPGRSPAHGEPSAAPAAPESAPIRSLLRWLPRTGAVAALGGRVDRVHSAAPRMHARMALWWSTRVLHPGDFVGAPRGGAAPGSTPDYDVAVTPGGYLSIRSGVLTGWRSQPDPDVTVIRADGEVFDHTEHGPAHPYFIDDYRQMTDSDIVAALRRAGAGEVTAEDVTAVVRAVLSSRDPAVCSCAGDVPAPPSGQTGAWVVPPELLADAAVLKVLGGEASADEATATLWRLSDSVADPSTVGQAMAAESASRMAGERPSDWPSAPISESVVAQVAAQAVRWHGRDVVRRMPAWLLGWVMVAQPVLADVVGSVDQLTRALTVADKVRVSRVDAQWSSMAATRRLLARASRSLEFVQDVADLGRHTEQGLAVDLRGAGRRYAVEMVAGIPLTECVRRAYRSDVRTWAGWVGG